jgi:hypothetical protein
VVGEPTTKERIGLPLLPYTAEIVSALVQLHYLNDERAAPPTVGAAIGDSYRIAPRRENFGNAFAPLYQFEAIIHA